MIAHLLSTTRLSRGDPRAAEAAASDPVEGLRAAATGHPDLRARPRRLARPLSDRHRSRERSVDSLRPSRDSHLSLGEHENLLAVKLDITEPAVAEAAVRVAVERFGRIDVLVNNAGNFYAGFFEEISPEHFRAQIETNLFGPMNVTRAVLPVMRAQRSGLVVTISSTAGLVGQEFVSAYAASKFALEGWMESLAPRSLRAASARCSSSPASSAPSCCGGRLHDLARAVDRRLRRAHAAHRRRVAGA